MKAMSKRIAFVVNHGAFFVSHRLPLAIHARHEGWDAQLFTGLPGSLLMEALADKQLSEVGIKHLRAGFHSSGINLLIELKGMIQLIWLLKKFQPDIIHCASPKGVLYGGIAAKFSRPKGVVFAISGMGFAYTDTDKLSTLRSIIRTIYGVLLRFSLSHSNMRVIVQNSDDEKQIINMGLLNRERVVVIPGSGVQLSDFQNTSALNKDKIILLPARMVADKGILEFVDAAKSIQALEPSWRFLLVGAADYKNPSALSREQLEIWQQQKYVEWLGHVHDMRELFTRAAIVCLPSYREGMPKVLLEAAAAGCAVVTTDVTGCREAIVDGKTGDLVPVRDSVALSKSLLSLMRDNSRRIRYGMTGQKRAQEIFSIDAVIEKTFKIYREVLTDAE
jgi:glycosyltransferase involved in cell wall biosynthesis